MKFGISTFVTDEGIRPAELGRAVEEREFDSLFVAEHTHIPVNLESRPSEGAEIGRIYYRTLDPIVTLTAAAMVTQRLLVGTGIALVIQRDPIILAKEVASLDLVSQGRAALGVGVGWNREEMSNHGTDPSTRGRLANEQLAAIREIWTAEQAEYHGSFVDFDPIYAWPKPLQRPHPPIYVGGDSPRAIERAARHGDAWLAHPLAPEEIASGARRLDELAGRHVPVTIYGAPADAELVGRYQELGVERVQLRLPTQPRDESLRELDRLAEFAAGFTG